jgi:hypothetical protein
MGNISKRSSNIVAPHAPTHAPGNTDALPWSVAHGYGTTAAQPIASSVNAGYLYYDTNLEILYRSNGVTWDALTVSAASSTFTNPLPSTTSVGGISAGTAFPTPQTLQQMMDAQLYPYISPAFTAFAITGQTSPTEVGHTIPASVTFTWSTSTSGNINSNSISIIDVTGGNLTLASSLANDGTEAVVMGGSIQKTTNTSHQFKITAVNTHSVGFNTTLTISWRWRMYFGVQAAATLSAAQILALASNQLATGYAGTYSMGAGGFKYICLSTVNGGQISSVKDQSTGFSVPMATSTDNAAYSNVDGGGFSFALVSVTNVEGITSSVRVYRTKNSLGGAVVLVVT